MVTTVVLARHWKSVHFGDLYVETAEGQHLFQVQVYLDELEPDAVRVELYADGRDGDAPPRQEIVRGEPLVGGPQEHTAYQCLAAEKEIAQERLDAAMDWDMWGPK